MTARAVSASQIETYSSCQRKWAWRAIAKIEVPPHASAAKGSLIHKQFERYLRGESLDYSTPSLREAAERAMPGIANLPPPATPGLLVEHGFSFETSRGIVFRGFVDLVVPDSASVPGCEGGAPCVVDHKSTSSFRWAKSTDVLMTDVQAMIYAYWAMSHFKVPVVDLVWNYVTTKGAAATERRHLRAVQSHVVEQFLGPIVATATELCATYEQQPKPLDLAPNLAACDAYGGCPYRALCTDLHSGPLGHQDLFEPFPTLTKGSPMTMDLFSRLESVKATEDAAPLPAGITNAPADFVPRPFLMPNAIPVAEPHVAINPPEWQPPPTPEQRAAATVTAEAVPAKRTRRTKAQMAADAALQAGTASRVVLEMANPVDELVAETERIMPDAYKTEAATIPAPVLAPVPREFTGGGFGEYNEPTRFTLYLDCAPENKETLHGYHLYGKVNEELQKTFGADFRRIKFEGPGLFCAGFLKLFDENPRDIVIDTRTAEGLLVVDSLRARAGLVIR